MPQSEQESSIQLTTKTGAVRVNNIKCWIEFFGHIVREITVIPEENEKYKVANVKLVLPPERTKACGFLVYCCFLTWFDLHSWL